MSETRQCHYQYTVKRGDSYYLIAHRAGVRLRDLLEANPTIPPARLTVGDVLCIPYGQEVQTPACEQQMAGSTQEEPSAQPPAETPAAPACPPNRRTVVQNNQTAGDLMLRYDLSYHTLQSANPGTDLEDIKGGDVLCIPEQNTPCALPTTVTLQEGDTVQSVADTYHIPVGALLRANPCLAPGDFASGVTVRLPE